MDFRRLAYSLLGIFGSAVLALGSVYALKLGDCPTIKSYNTSGHFDVAFVYGAGDDVTKIRATDAAYLHKQDIVDHFIPLGGYREIIAAVNELIMQGVQKERIIIPSTISSSTRENIEVGYQTVASRNLGTRIAHVSSRRHLPRIKMLNDEYNAMNPSDDGYFGSDDSYGTPLSELLPDLRAMVYGSDVREWLACVANGRK
ncbi:MAG: YdcF family protein [Candidatus Aenigmarchaeota archaeon]|nr:YdcF family protein [Candidatus Aenigmarchaeota archaeon]